MTLTHDSALDCTVTSALETTVQDLQTQKFSMISAANMREATGISPQEWAAFADHWNRLTLDQHMGDGGTYRLRRYGQFNTDGDGGLYQLPHGPYEQPLYINRLNGGVDRTFDPLEEEFAQHPVLHRIMEALRDTMDAAEGHTGNWNIRLHPYRIVARDGAPGLPTPEGLHRDGVHYVVSMLVRRHVVLGGESLITDNDAKPLARHTLLEPMETFIANDEETMHAVSALKPMIPGQPAWRDVLVVAFTRLEAA